MAAMAQYRPRGVDLQVPEQRPIGLEASGQFVLQNWGALGDRVSHWTLRDAELVRVGP